MKKILFPALACLSLAACEDFWNREGVGFTGLDGEPKTFSEEKGVVDYITRRESVPAELARLAPVQTTTDATEMHKIAGVAIDHGGRTPTNAVEVGGQDKTLMLSNVEVNGILFAVLRTQEGTTSKMDASVGNSFSNAIPRLTGCLANGSAYQKGSAGRRTTGFAVPLDCS